MKATILIIQYKLSALQKGLTPGQWQERAKQIGSFDGLRWKYWLEAGTEERGGVYLFDSEVTAKQAKELLTSSLNQAGALDVTTKMYSVDNELSSITRAYSAGEPI